MYILIIYMLLTFVLACNAISCYQCDSIAMPECAMTLNFTELPIVECPSTSVQCVKSIVDSATYRGCSGYTNVTGATFYSYCMGNLCNTGVYPYNRRRCYQCSGSECGKEIIGDPLPCRWHSEKDECFTDIINGTQTVRGCLSDENTSLSTDAKFCTSNGCNYQATIKTLTCAQCDSRYHRGCKMNEYNLMYPICNIEEYKRCHIEYHAHEPKSCYTYHKLSHVVRGCTHEISEELERDHVVECNDQDYCNTLCFRRQKCLSCDSSVNASCFNNITEFEHITCSSLEISSCYVFEYDDNNVKRGCGPPPNYVDIKRRHECDGPGCNSGNFKRCYQCSSETSPVCAKWDVPGFGINVEDCRELNSACVTAEFKNGIVLRGCESDYLSLNNKDIVELQSCEGSFCNTSNLQTVHCYQCSGAADCELALTLPPMPCPPMENTLISQIQACLIFNNPEVGIVRGCQHNSELYYQCLLNDRMNDCEFCYEDGCNQYSRKYL